MTVSLSQGTFIVPRLSQDARTLRINSKAFAAMSAYYGQYGVHSKTSRLVIAKIVIRSAQTQ